MNTTKWTVRRDKRATDHTKIMDGSVCIATANPYLKECSQHAALIAAAPDLLEACESVNTILDCVTERGKEAPNGICDCYRCETARIVKRAIANAKGK